MPNLSSVLKAEISRISRREIKQSIKSIHSSNVSLKKTIADLKKRIADLEANNKRLVSNLPSVVKASVAINPEEAGKARITAKTIRKLREKLGLSLERFAKLIDVSSQNVFVMEHKQGRLRFRGNTLKNILAVRGLGKREAKKKLDEIESCYHAIR